LGQKLKMWFLVTRPWSFPMTIISITLGTLLAYCEGIFDGVLYVLTLIGTVLAHAGANVINDYYDTKYKVDTVDAPTAKYRMHPVLSGFTSLFKLEIFGSTMFVAAFIIGVYLTLVRGPFILLLAILGAILAISYSGIPFKYKYKALGEPAVFLIWGPLMVLGSYYVQTGNISWKVIAASIPLGLLVSAVLLANNIRDMDYDRKVGTKTLPIVVGRSLAFKTYVTLIIAPYVVTLILSMFKMIPLWSIATIITLPKAINLIKTFKTKVPENADALTSSLMLTFGIVFLLSLLVESFYPI